MAASTTQPSISVLLPPGTAPCTLHVSNPAASLTARTDWDFGDPLGKFNHLAGFNAAHVYDQPGKYTVTLTVTEPGAAPQSSTATIIVDRDTRQRIFISPEGDDSNTGRSPDAPLHTLARAAHLLHDGSDLLLAAGATYALPTSVQISSRDILIDRYGDGPDPILLRIKGNGTSALALETRCDGITIQHLTFDSPYPADPAGPAPKIGIIGIQPRGRNITVRDCKFLNVDDAINANGAPRGLLVQGCTAPLTTGIRGYLIWGQGMDHVYLANQAANSTREHIVRMSGVKRVLVADNDFTNLDRRPADKDDYSKGTIEAHQGSYIYIVHNKVADGTIRVGPLGGANESPDTATEWVVIDGNTVTDTSILAYAGSHHIMIRNNMIRKDKDASITISAPDTFGRISGDFTIINNIAVNNSDAGSFLRVWGKTNGIVLKENSFAAPNLKYGLHGSAAVNVSEDNLSSFLEIAGNTWPADGCFIVGHGADSLRNAEAWGQMKPVQGDTFKDLPIDPTTVPTTQYLHNTPN
jgi:PKD repeat protein